MGGGGGGRHARGRRPRRRGGLTALQGPPARLLPRLCGGRPVCALTAPRGRGSVPSDARGGCWDDDCGLDDHHRRAQPGAARAQRVQSRRLRGVACAPLRQPQPPHRGPPARDVGGRARARAQDGRQPRARQEPQDRFAGRPSAPLAGRRRAGAQRGRCRRRQVHSSYAVRADSARACGGLRGCGRLGRDLGRDLPEHGRGDPPRHEAPARAPRRLRRRRPRCQPEARVRLRRLPYAARRHDLPPDAHQRRRHQSWARRRRRRRRPRVRRLQLPSQLRRALASSSSAAAAASRPQRTILRAAAQSPSSGLAARLYILTSAAREAS
mmetsp:Transcript_7088/g.22664  ORF Transcript_7088/g.22664 Transcript_7088/m.22664 type:complete len:325 (+) Transcript_7088:310-1284(+)